MSWKTKVETLKLDSEAQKFLAASRKSVGISLDNVKGAKAIYSRSSDLLSLAGKINEHGWLGTITFHLKKGEVKVSGKDLGVLKGDYAEFMMDVEVLEKALLNLQLLGISDLEVKMFVKSRAATHKELKQS